MREEEVQGEEGEAVREGRKARKGGQVIMFKRHASSFLLVLCVLVVSAIAVSSASAASPWWHVTSGARPSYLPADVHPPVGRDEVQEIKVEATGGNVVVVEPASLEEFFKGQLEFEELKIAQFAYNATPQVAQAALEGVYGSGNVRVREGASGPTSYAVAFPDQPREPMKTEFSALGGLQGTATTTEVTHGAYNGPTAQIVVTADNLGDVSTSGETTITDRLPGGLRAVAAVGHMFRGDGPYYRGPEPGCVPVGRAPGELAQSAGAVCRFKGALLPFGALEARITVVVETAATCEQNASNCEKNGVSVTGGGAPGVSISRPVTVSEKPTPFGVESYEVTPEEEGGLPTTQAGRHPFQVTGSLTLNEAPVVGRVGGEKVLPVALPKDLAGLLPPGLIGNPVPFPKCTLSQFFKETCPQQSVLGVALIRFYEPKAGYSTVSTPIVDLEPAPGEAARFAFLIIGVPTFIDVHVRGGENYGVTLSSSDIPELIGFLSYRLTFWGVPGEASHDSMRGTSCLAEAQGLGEKYTQEKGLVPCKPLGENNPPPFLTMPTSCTGPLHTSTEADSWEEQKPEGQRTIVPETEPMPAMDGCNRLPFEPQIKVTPDGSETSTPTGLTVDVHVSQESILAAKGLAQSDVRNITVALPEGVAVDPAGGGGLEACSEHLVGFEGSKTFETSPGVSLPAFTPKLPGSFGSSEKLEQGINFCPNASKIGTVRIKTPFLPNALEGAVYLASQEANPFGSLVAMYVVAEDPVSGVLVKLAGSVHLTETGQLVTTFENTPEAAFEDAELHFFGGERAPLASPERCGPYTTNASFVPWSANASDVAAVSFPASSTFNVTSGRNGAPCPGQTLPFNPTLTAGTTSIQAGGFSPFTMTMSRPDGNQHLQAIELKTPAGVSGLLSGVKLCPEPQANEGLCGPESLIGETTVSVGVGGQPFTVTGGKVYITGPYHGASFGLSIVNPAKAGPFDLEHTRANHPACDCLLVRAKIEVDPITASLRVTSDNSGPFKIPTSLEGIPLQIQHVNVTINRPGFTFNPTNCTPTAITGSLQSAEGSSQLLSVPFQATNCAVLGFKPGFKVSTSGKTSRSNGASLTVKLSYPKAAFGSQANIKSVKVDLPKQLPSRLTTLQKACTAAQFETNPAGCPGPSIVGHAKAITPLVPVPLEGPAYFVSYGGAKFPELVIVLSGYGVTIDLHGETFISKAGITSSTFKAVPDAPVGSFELTLPQGKDSALAANGNLCKSKLVMPTLFVAQNGAVIKQNTRIGVTGCAKAKKANKHHRKSRKK
jgi:hypothetical protein